MLERPAAAPRQWGQDDSLTAVSRAVADHSPELVLFQELPDVVPFVETHGMIQSNPQTHSGRLATLVDHSLLDSPITHQVTGNWALLTTLPEHDLTIANVHLAPGAAAADERVEQLSAVVDASPSAALLIVGDTNTRLDEEPAIAELGLCVRRPPNPTWDSRRNRFRATGPKFTAFFTRWFNAGSIRVENPTVHVEPCRPAWNDRDAGAFHLSDHYALSGDVEFDFSIEKRRTMTD